MAAVPVNGVRGTFEVTLPLIGVAGAYSEVPRTGVAGAGEKHGISTRGDDTANGEPGRAGEGESCLGTGDVARTYRAL